jgi:hypothetical protein
MESEKRFEAEGRIVFKVGNSQLIITPDGIALSSDHICLNMDPAKVLKGEHDATSIKTR